MFAKYDTFPRNCSFNLALIILLGGAFLLAPRAAWAYSQYSQNKDDTYCRACHGNFRGSNYTSLSDGQDWGNLHDLHKDTMLDGDCSTCHGSGPRFPVLIGVSEGGNGMSAISCSGCHGREEDRSAGYPVDGRGAGLRQHHHQAGTTICLGCHDDADPGAFSTIGENILPDYFANPGTGHPNIPADPCNGAGTENFAGVADGLDNDGDGLYDSADDDCSSAVCGDDVVDPGETCDPPSSCPVDCDDLDACTADSLSGSAANCDAECTNPPITACTDSDGCCPSGCDETSDNDCAPVCGNDVVEAGETCDPPGSCPPTCDDFDACTTNNFSGSAATCDVVCTHDAITACSDDDGCCPTGCDDTNDNNCAAGVCGDDVVNPGETCDPPSSCPTDCNDFDSCTADILGGSATTCDVTCTNDPVTACADGDGCCPAGCNETNDNDCSPVCGNGVIETSEVCDPQSSCPSSCEDSDLCTVDSLSGAASTCDAVCANTPITSCVDDDGCCPAGCDETNDNNCVAGICGDGVVNPGETCDPPESCTDNCDDGNGCTQDSLSGAAATCDAVCSSTPITNCGLEDGCCPEGCLPEDDLDCGLEDDPQSNADGGCGCRVAAGNGNGPLFLLGLAVLLLWHPIRRRSHRKSNS